MHLINKLYLLSAKDNYHHSEQSPLEIHRSQSFGLKNLPDGTQNSFGYHREHAMLGLDWKMAISVLGGWLILAKTISSCATTIRLGRMVPRPSQEVGIFRFTIFALFMGSLDGKNWTNLRVHENDGTVCKPGQFASWSITGPNALLPFRYFRVVLTRPTVDATNPWNFCLCYLELYGYFH
ncbi:hypothetical protein Ahy_B06g086010 isoform E [Arachis hypogaea]|uniref:F5/8 type C domain-containing protein n=1 Tax=Arachis hypogaea TaxID=3818 RepID=A0A444YWB3_ARAHY|nr:hypothetical protein Ahy_B06g086010 isoform E [Arachis hypogaea]